MKNLVLIFALFGLISCGGKMLHWQDGFLDTNGNGGSGNGNGGSNSSTPEEVIEAVLPELVDKEGCDTIFPEGSPGVIAVITCDSGEQYIVDPEGNVTSGTINDVVPGSDTESNPGTDAGNNPGTGSENNPGSDAGSNPGTDAGNNPGSDAGNNPGSDAGNNPGTDTENNPGSDAGNNPGTDAGSNPGTDAGNNPGTGSENNPGTGSENNPGTDAGNNPGDGSEQNSDQDTDNDEEQYVCNEEDNFIINGSFEEGHNLGDNKWGLFKDLDGWFAMTWIRDAAIEIQNGDKIGGLAASDGTAKLELDAHNKDGFTQSDAIVAQNIYIPKTGIYKLSFDYSPRVIGKMATNKITVKWNGRKIAKLKGKTVGWKRVTVYVQGKKGDENQVLFKGKQDKDTLGGFIDNVSLTPICGCMDRR